MLSIGLLLPLGSSVKAYPYGSSGYNYSTPSYSTPSYNNPRIIHQTGPNNYSGYGNDTYRGVNGIQPKLGISNPTGGWVQNNKTGSFHQCTGLGICTD